MQKAPVLQVRLRVENRSNTQQQKPKLIEYKQNATQKEYATHGLKTGLSPMGGIDIIVVLGGDRIAELGGLVGKGLVV